MSSAERYLESSAGKVVRLVEETRKANPGKRAILRTRDVTICLEPQWRVFVGGNPDYVSLGHPANGPVIVLIQATKIIEVLVE